MFNLIIHLRKIFQFFLVAKRSNYTVTEKLQIIKFLLINHFKGVLCTHDKIISQKIFDYTVSAYNYKTLQYLFLEIFISEEYKFHTQVKTPFIIDCGANIGMSVLYFKKKHPNSKIIAFEPNPYAFEILTKNVQQNKLQNVWIHNLALTDNNGNKDFYFSQKDSLVGSFNKARGGGSYISVRTNRLSSFIEYLEIDLVKIDVEGAEIEIINDLLITDKLKFIKRFFIEYHHKINGAKSDFAAFLKKFEENEFEYSIRADYTEIGMFQDIFMDLYKTELK